MYRKNTAGQFVVVQLLLTATGAVAAGLSPAARRCIDGTFAAGGGTFTEDGATGSYKYALAQADTNGNDISIIITATGAIPVVVNFVTTAADPTNAATFGITDIDAAISSRMATYTQPTGFLAATFPSGTVANQTNITGGTITTVGTLTTYTGNTVQTGDAFARLGAPAGASVSADVAAIKGDTGTILTDVNAGAGAIYTRIGAPAGASIAADIAAVKSDSGTTLTDAIAIKAQTDKLAFTVTNQVDANALSINGNATAAANVAHTNQALARGTVGAASTTTSVICSAIASPASVGASGQFIGRTILFDADTATTNLQGQATNITANTTGATPTFTVTALTTSPVSGDKFSIV